MLKLDILNNIIFLQELIFIDAIMLFSVFFQSEKKKNKNKKSDPLRIVNVFICLHLLTYFFLWYLLTLKNSHYIDNSNQNLAFILSGKY